jgi:hypothetical protein
MPSIDGRLEWDDDELTPGKKKEGGLHSTLFDADGNLRSSARFLPNEDDREAEPETVYMHVYHEVPAPPKTPEQEAFENAVAELLNRLVDYGIERLTPHAVRFWEDKARPALRSKLAKVKAKTKMKKTNGDESGVALPALADACTDVTSVQEDKVEMTDAEARARYMLALAARAFSDEQMRVLAAANVVDDNSYAELERASAELPAHEAATLIAALTSPSLLGEDVLAELRRILEDTPAVREPALIEAQAAVPAR